MATKLGKTILAGLGAASLVAVAACAEPPADDNGNGNDPEASFTACMVTDTGGVDDRSFNASAWLGMENIRDDNDDIAIEYRQSNSSADFEPNLRTFIDEGCDFIMSVGGLMEDAAEQIAQENPDVRFGIVDGMVAEPNVHSMEFNTAESSFLAGYLAAGMTETGAVGTYGGMNIAPVTIFMDGFAEGVAHYNDEHGEDIEVLGWNVESQSGSFTDDFQDTTAGRALAETLVSQGADIVFPVAGPAGVGAAAVADEDDNVSLIWVDIDGCTSLEEYCDDILSTSVKNIPDAVYEAIENAYNEGDMDAHYVGTLENNGVSLAPFHEMDSLVSDELKSELEALEAAIIAGDVTVESPATPERD
ncbi:BMP family lipoprotein [Natronoglycomyces albus]|uniref:BMP family ABC transporter substrate-binding protein n=1 Tax=Natronoglycomyces albus TaxID=2811108 RepID=A0A895XL80_9ACTN|nr:BMP family ABC transporter substrate-binding protein [Natronoglycomyces albus]QSB05827.1 BMP family ABC transporter substrate-binding protein [Natronoglycomyces albus]